MVRVCQVDFVSATKVTAEKVVQMFAQMHAAEMVIALMGLVCATQVGLPAIAPLLVVVAAMVLATHLMVVVCVTTVGLVQNAIMSSSVRTQHVPGTVFVPMVFAYVPQDTAANCVSWMSGVVMVCAESTGLAIMPLVSVCAVVVGLDHGAICRKFCA